MGFEPEDFVVQEWSSVKRGGFSLTPIQGIKITHIPTGLTAECDSEQSQHKNKALAIKSLKSQITNSSEFKEGWEYRGKAECADITCNKWYQVLQEGRHVFFRDDQGDRRFSLDKLLAIGTGRPIKPVETFKRNWVYKGTGRRSTGVGNWYAVYKGASTTGFYNDEGGWVTDSLEDALDLSSGKAIEPESISIIGMWVQHDDSGEWGQVDPDTEVYIDGESCRLSHFNLYDIRSVNPEIQTKREELTQTIIQKQNELDKLNQELKELNSDSSL